MNRNDETGTATSAGQGTVGAAVAAALVKERAAVAAQSIPGLQGLSLTAAELSHVQKVVAEFSGGPVDVTHLGRSKALADCFETRVATRQRTADESRARALLHVAQGNEQLCGEWNEWSATQHRIRTAMAAREEAKALRQAHGLAAMADDGKPETYKAAVDALVAKGKTANATAAKAFPQSYRAWTAANQAEAKR